MSEGALSEVSFGELAKASRRAALVSLIGFFLVICAMAYAALNLSRLEHERQQLLMQRRGLQQDIQGAKSEREALQKEVNSLRQQRDTLNVSVGALVAKIDQLRGTAQQFEKQFEALKSEAVRAWEKVPPTEGWCFQRSDPKNKYSVYCHWSQERCNKARTSSKSDTECVLVENLDQQDWKPSPRGFMDSWYQANLTGLLPSPFPQRSNSQQIRNSDSAKSDDASANSTPIEVPVPPSTPPPFVPLDKMSLVEAKPPSYPPLARQARIQGVVRLNVVIGEDGKVVKVEVVDGNPMLAPAAIEAVKHWVFRPYEVDHKPVSVQTEIEQSFTLSGG